MGLWKARCGALLHQSGQGCCYQWFGIQWAICLYTWNACPRAKLSLAIRALPGRINHSGLLCGEKFAFSDFRKVFNEQSVYRGIKMFFWLCSRGLLLKQWNWRLPRGSYRDGILIDFVNCERETRWARCVRNLPVLGEVNRAVGEVSDNDIKRLARCHIPCSLGSDRILST